jgi:endonuclease YncB( thermonuclease family)
MRLSQIQLMREPYPLHTTKRLVASALAFCVICMPGSSVRARSDATDATERLSGLVRVIDGDTISIGETRVRLEGIDAPESEQTCKRKWFGSWPCGATATSALAKLVEGRPVSCDPRGHDKYGRVLAICYADGKDINAQMVRQGLAWAFVKYSKSYVTEEAQARAEGIGIWQGDAVPAWEYRAGRWASAEGEAPQGCAIKGNVTKHGKIYHMPWSPWYTLIKIEPDKGKRWFCTETEALAAGWRPVQTH